MSRKSNSKVHVRPPQVFINFRGDELRDNFVNQLVRALREGDINVFIDAHELKGRKLKTLFTRIENSKIALAVFSKRYCESEWCLDELAEMSKQMKERNLVVIPIFYNVTANDVKRACNLDRKADFKGEGNFTILFKKMKEKHADDHKLVNRWELALKSVTERIGFSTEVYGRTLVKSIVVEVRRHLRMPLEKPKSGVDAAFAALLASSIFSFIVAPLIFPDLTSFKAGKWVSGLPFLVLVWHIWNRENKNKALAYISQMSHITIWQDRDNHNKSSANTWDWDEKQHHNTSWGGPRRAKGVARATC